MKVEGSISKILIIDDFQTNIEFIRNILEKEDYEIYSCYNSELSVEVISRLEFDLILLDIVMPKVDGYEVCKSIRKSKLNSNTPVIFITSEKNEESIIKGFELGARDYIIRPFSSKELIARVNLHIELKKRSEELENVNSHLEDLVRMRTQELNSALTELNASFEYLKHAQKELELLDKAKENFLQIISHEIRTPLNSILGFTELLKDACMDKKYIDYLNIMNKSVKRLENFSMKALLITQLKTGLYHVNYSDTNLSQQIHEVIHLLDESIHKNNLKIKIEIDDFKLNTDKHLLKHIIFNLFENAVNYSPKNSTIRVMTEKESDYYCQFSISDQGNGFPNSVLKNENRIFSNDDFIDNNPGLGIYTTYLIVKILKGNLILENNGNKGATAIVRLKV
ncbi:MAG: response regulator [Bacteroidales bacterium]|nr:response regulator [Bacteroidales bacterium]